MARTRKTAADAPETAAEKTKQKTKQPPTRYVVLRQFEPTGDLVNLLQGVELWQDVAVFETHGAPQAIKAAVGVGADAKGGVYRAFPARSDMKVPVHIEQTIKINFGANGAGKES